MSKGSNRIAIGQTNLAILRGELDLSTWSDEELQRGYRRDKNGKWSGRPPVIVPKAIHDEMVRRKMSEAYDLLRDNVVEAVKVLVAVATDCEVDAGVRVKAATVILDRVLGRAPERIHVEVEPPWSAAIRNAIVEYGPIQGVVSIAATSTDEAEA